MSFFKKMKEILYNNFEVFMYSCDEVCKRLSISLATYSNWKKENLIPSYLESESLSIDDYIQKIRNIIEEKLSSRANRTSSKKKYINYHGIQNVERKLLLLQILEQFEKSSISIEKAVVLLIICQLKTEQLLSSDWFENPKNRIECDCKKWFLENCLKLQENPFEYFTIPYCNDDFLGAFYQSAQSIGEKSTAGSFYTPKKLLNGIFFDDDKSVYDPCCGSGNILINVISKNHSTNLIFASDIDKTALKICEANLVLFFHNPDIKSHIFEKSLLSNSNEPDKTYITNSNIKYDYIISNPPWGARFSIEEKKYLLKEYPILKTTESFSICLYNASKMIKEDGKLLFFLPKSFLYVATHQNIRNYILTKPFSLKITIFGHAFSQVFSECILLQLTKSKKYSSNDEIIVNNFDKNYTLPKKLCFSSKKIIPALITPENYDLIEKIYNYPHIYLKNNCDFALGIVTGNNKKYLFSQDSDRLQMPSASEPIYRGKNIEPYCIKKSEEYIVFTPEKFQQTGPEKFYRSRKIMYRFIYDRPVCAISENGELPLNSANVFIPKIDYPFETIIALFNSSIYAIIFQTLFNSVKILKSHLSDLPIPLFSPEQHNKIKDQYDKIINSEKKQEEIQKMDLLLADFFGIKIL